MILVWLGYKQRKIYQNREKKVQIDPETAEMGKILQIDISIKTNLKSFYSRQF